MMHGLEPWVPFILTATILLLAGFIQSAIGFGFGVTALALLPLVIDARTSHILIAASSVPVLATASWAWRGETDWRSLGLTLLGALVFMPVGQWLFGAMSIDLLTRVTGIAIIVIVQLTSGEPSTGAKATSTISSLVAGGVSGFLAGAVSIAGPPIAAVAIKQQSSPEKFKAFIVRCLLPIAIFRFIGLLATGFVTHGIILQSAWAMPFAISGVYLGAVTTRQIRPCRFRTVVSKSLIMAACLLVFRGSPSEHSSTSPTETASDTTNHSLIQRNSEQ